MPLRKLEVPGPDLDLCLRHAVAAECADFRQLLLTARNIGLESTGYAHLYVWRAASWVADDVKDVFVAFNSLRFRAAVFAIELTEV